jgi:hypothetical protein
MGRGRAKAKQAKVARALKYHSPDTDLAALQRELGGRSDEGYASRRGASSGDHAPDSEAEDADEYADEDVDEDVDDEDDTDDGNWATRHS